MKILTAILGLVMLAGCGGAQAQGGVLTAGGSGDTMTDTDTTGDAGPLAADGTPMDPSAATGPYTIELVNKGDSDLMVSVKKGWQPVLYALQGQPPKAKSFMLFPKHCMQSCDVAAADMCPICEVVEENVVRRRKLEMAQKKDITILPGESVKIPWDGRFYSYEPVPAEARTKKKPGCKCHRSSEAEPGEYEFRVATLRRATKKVGTPARRLNLKQTITLPLPAGTTTITFDVE